jgi:hypothetical protein
MLFCLRSRESKFGERSHDMYSREDLHSGVGVFV